MLSLHFSAFGISPFILSAFLFAFFLTFFFTLFYFFLTFFYLFAFLPFAVSTVNLTKDHTSLLQILHWEQCLPGLSCCWVFLSNSQPLVVTSSWRRRAWCRTWKYLKVPQFFNHCISHSFIARFFKKETLSSFSFISFQEITPASTHLQV